MAYTPKNDMAKQSKEILKFDGFNGSWDEYLAYLEQNNIMSTNIEWDGRGYSLRAGYYPQWKLKDFI